jgi:hypothetical protein
MSKNSPKQTFECFKEWLEFMKFKPRSKKPHVDAHNSIGEFMKHNK